MERNTVALNGPSVTPTFVVRNVFLDRAVRGEVFDEQCHRGRAVLHVRAVFREVGVVPTQCFVTVRISWGVFLPGSRGGGKMALPTWTATMAAE
jgi:hypothetical protein